MSAKIYATLRLRLDANSALNRHGCWEWQGARSAKGYGRINMRIDGKHKSLWAHIVAFEEYVRKLLPGEEVDHLCYNRACINPLHLQAVSKTTNLARRRPSGSHKEQCHEVRSTQAL